MREIEFRAIGSVDTNWYYGQYSKCNSYKETVDCIIDDENNFIEIDFETVGQFTGLLDKNGKKIFEGDIIRTRHNYHANEVSEGKVYFDEFQWFGACDYLDYIANNCYVEVIGNIHEKEEQKCDDPGV